MFRALLGLALVAALLAAAHWASPWPGVIALRWVFDRGAAAASAGLVPYLPADVIRTPDIRPDPDDPAGGFDLYRPAGTASRALPVIVWIHGGGFVSGRKEDVGNYARVLAGQGFAVATPDYMLAPDAVFPAPVEQVNRTLAYVRDNAATLGVDAGRVVLAGDSAGAQVAAQLAAITTSAAAAAEIGVAPALPPSALRGVILFCGPYDLSLMGGAGAAGLFMGIVGRAYSGRRDWRGDPGFARFTVTDDVTSGFPPAFISAGNADPLLPHSQALAAALDAAGVTVETLFWPADHAPGLGHEYQFDLDRPEARMALERAMAFARRVTAPGGPAEDALQPDEGPIPSVP